MYAIHFPFWDLHVVFSLFTRYMRLFGMFDFFVRFCASSVIVTFLTVLGLLFDFS